MISKTGTVYMRRVNPTHPLDVVGGRGDYLPYRFAVEDGASDRGDRFARAPYVTRLHAAGLLCVFTVRSVEREGMWRPFFHLQP